MRVFLVSETHVGETLLEKENILNILKTSVCLLSARSGWKEQRITFFRLIPPLVKQFDFLH
jgi:hypothetical protein